MTGVVVSSAKEPKSPQEKRHDFLLQQRDKHLSQFMEINGKAVFTALVPIVTVTLAVDDVRGKFADSGGWFVAIVACGAAGIGLIFLGALILSTFHTRAIRSIQNRLAGTLEDTATGAWASIGITLRTLWNFVRGKVPEPVGMGVTWFEVTASDIHPRIECADYEIVPHNPAANTLIFAGLMAMTIAAIAALVGSMRIDDSAETPSTSYVAFPACPFSIPKPAACADAAAASAAKTDAPAKP